MSIGAPLFLQLGSTMSGSGGKTSNEPDPDKDKLIAMTSQVEEESSAAATDANALRDKDGDADALLDEIISLDKNGIGSGSGSEAYAAKEDQRFDEQTFAQSRIASRSKRSLAFWRKVVAPTCATRAQMEVKLCFPLVFTGMIPSKWGVHMIANSVALKCVRETLENTFTNMQGATKPVSGPPIVDHSEIADAMSPIDGVLTKRGPWKGHREGEPTGKFCKDYCKTMKGHRLCFPKNNKLYKDEYLRKNVLTFTDLIPDEADRLRVWNHINYCKDACTDDPTSGSHQCKAETNVGEMLLASQDAAHDTIIPEYDGTEIGAGGVESAQAMCRQHDGTKDECCQYEACGYDSEALACKARGDLADESVLDACLSRETRASKLPAFLDRGKQTPDKDILKGLEEQCNGGTHTHACRDTLSIVGNLFMIDAYGVHMFHGVGFDYSMKSCGPFFTKMAMSRLSSQFPKLVSGNELGTLGDGGPTADEKAAQKELEAQQLVDRVARPRRTLKGGSAVPTATMWTYSTPCYSSHQSLFCSPHWQSPCTLPQR